jgi:hypothetical protein
MIADRRLTQDDRGVIVARNEYVVLIKQLKAGVSPPLLPGEASAVAAWEWVPDAVEQRGGTVLSQSVTSGLYEWVLTIELDPAELPSLTAFLTERTVAAPVVLPVVRRPFIRPRKGGG